MKKFKSINEFCTFNPIITYFLNLLRKVFSQETEPTRQSLMMILISFLYINGCESIRFMYEHFLGKYFHGEMRSYYYTLEESKLYVDDWPLKLLDLIISAGIIAVGIPIFLIIDDTLVKKMGDHFEFKTHLYNHAAKDGNCYLDGHCFVSLVILLPIIWNGSVKYIRIPLCHRMWIKEDEVTKLQMAAEMISMINSKLEPLGQRCTLCDSWYAKGEMMDLNTEKGIPFVTACASNTALYDLPPDPEPGKRGRKRIRGAARP